MVEEWGHERVVGWVDGWWGMGGLMEGWLGGGWMDEWVGGCMDGWSCEWVDGLLGGWGRWVD